MAGAIVAIVVVIFLVILFARTIRIVPQAKAGIVERFGRYHRTLNPGLTVLMPFVDRPRRKLTNDIDIPWDDEILELERMILEGS